MDGRKDAESLSGVVEDVVYRNDANDYTVLSLSSNGLLITAVGQIPAVSEGEILELVGNWTYHKEFGKQFSFVSYTKSLPTEIDGIIRYLSSRAIKGVGPVTALKIVNRYGMDSFDVIENHPEWLTDIPGITMKKASVICQSFKEQSELRSIMMFFGDSASSSDVAKIYKKLGASAIGVIKNNPYVLTGGEFGIPFDKVDKIAVSLGFSPEASERVRAGILYVLDYNATLNGHTCLPEDKLVGATAEALGVSYETVRDNLGEFVSQGEIERYSDGISTMVMTEEVASIERFVAARLKEMNREIPTFSAVDVASMIQATEVRLGVKYADLQRLALFHALTGGVTVITGGPGTGKTTVVRAMIALFENMGIKSVLCAPTGRAAKRLSEATGCEAKTVHRTLEMERDATGANVFGRNMRNPLDEGVVILDEASMMDLSLMGALMRAMKRGGRLVLIGDSDQLPSVGAGNVLADIIASGAVETVCLTEIFRQSKESLIVTNAHRINRGEMPILNGTARNCDFFFVRRENEGDIAETVASLVTERLPRTYGKEIREQIQVITPSKKGAGGVENLNEHLQRILNPKNKLKKERLAHGTVFREGDKVMQIANNYELIWEKNGIEGCGIFNGDVGYVEEVDLNEEALRIRFDDRTVSYPFENLDELELAYAITVHKSQGSEYPVVIIPMYSCAPMLMTRNLLYTAVTRAKRMVVLVGRGEVACRMVSNNREVLRYTTLLHRLTSLVYSEKVK